MGIVRAIIAVVVGYIVMAALVIGGFIALTIGLGPDRLFKSGSYESSPAFIACALVISAVCAIAGGYVCGLIARSRIPLLVLAALVLVFGSLSGAVNAAKPDPGPRPSAASTADLMTNSKQPVWYGYSLGVVGGLGILLGGRLRR